MLNCLRSEGIKFVFKEFVPECLFALPFDDVRIFRLLRLSDFGVRFGSFENARVKNLLFDPLSQFEKFQNACICDELFEICIFNPVSSICESNPCRVSAELLYRCIECKEIAGTLAHLLAVEGCMAIHANSSGEILWPTVPDSLVDVEEEDKVIVDQIFSGASKVERIPVREFSSHCGKSVLRNVGFNFISQSVNVIPDIISHL